MVVRGSWGRFKPARESERVLYHWAGYTVYAHAMAFNAS